MTQPTTRNGLRRAMWMWIVVGSLLLGTTFLARAGAGYDLSWWTVDGGGIVSAGAGSYRLSGTAGQFDAGAGGGGGYRLSGGFWGAGPAALQGTTLYLPVVLRRKIMD